MVLEECSLGDSSFKRQLMFSKASDELLLGEMFEDIVEGSGIKLNLGFNVDMRHATGDVDRHVAEQDYNKIFELLSMYSDNIVNNGFSTRSTGDFSVICGTSELDLIEMVNISGKVVLNSQFATTEYSHNETTPIRCGLTLDYMISGSAARKGSEFVKDILRLSESSGYGLMYNFLDAEGDFTFFRGSAFAESLLSYRESKKTNYPSNVNIE